MMASQKTAAVKMVAKPNHFARLQIFQVAQECRECVLVNVCAMCVGYQYAVEVPALGAFSLR